MIYIKKVWLVGFFLAICLIVVIVLLNNSELEEVGENIAQKIAPTQDEDSQTSNEATEEKEPSEKENVLYNEDPVRDFLSEKVNQTINFFLNKNSHIVAIGDSLTEGIGDETENEGYVGILKDQINKDGQIASFENYGKLGNKTYQLLTRLKEEEEVMESITDADIILITIGSNDVMQVFKENFTDLTLDVFKEEEVDYGNRLMQIFTQMNVLNEEAKIYLIGFYNPFQRYFGNIEELNIIADNWNEVGESVTNQFDNVHFIPVSDLFVDIEEEYLADDYFHLNYYGYQILAERILKYLTKEEGEINVGTSEK